MDEHHFVVAAGYDLRIVPIKVQTKYVALMLLAQRSWRSGALSGHNVLHLPQKNPSIVTAF